MAERGKEYVLFYRSGKGGWHKNLEQVIYINDAKGYEYIDAVDLEDDPSIRKPVYVRGTPVLIRLEPYGEKGPSRWEGEHSLKMLQTISGTDKINSADKRPKGLGLPKRQPKKEDTPPRQRVTVPAADDDDFYGGGDEDDWGQGDPIEMDEADYAAEAELYPS